MKPKGLARHWLGASTLTALVVVNFIAPTASAASATWTGATDTLWATLTNWTANPVPGTGDTATFNSAGNGNTTIDLGGGVTVGSVLFDTASAAAYTIGAGAVGSQTLTLESAITMNSTVVNNQLFNANVALSANSTFTNDSTTNSLNFAGGISSATAGTKILTVQGAGNTNISGAITAGSGTMNLAKFGTGTLTLSGGGTLGAGSIVNGNANNLSAVFLGGVTQITGGTYTSAGEVVVGGVLTNGGAGVNTNLTMDGGSLTVNNWLSVGRGNGIGGVSSDLVLNNAATITATNFSGGFNGGSALNMPKGTVTLNNTSSLTVANSLFVAESGGSNITINVNGTSTLSQTAAGAGETRLGSSDNAIGTINVNGGTASFERDIIVGYAGASTGRLNMTSGTINVASTTERWLMVGRDNASKGEITIDGGNLNLNTNTDIRFGRNATSSGTSFVTLNGGAITGWTGNATGAFSGGSVIDMNNSSTQASFSSTFNLNGGTLTIGQIISNNNNGNAAFNFNGGTLRAAAASTTFIDLGGANQRVNVRNGGAIIDSNTFDVTITEALNHSNVGGDNAIDGGLTKNGTGTLTLTNAANSYTGNTLVNLGTLATGATGNLGLGNVTITASGALTIGNGNSIADTATLFFAAGAAGAIALNNATSDTVLGITQTDDSQSIGAGVYSAGDLNTFFGVTSFSGTGTLTVVPEPAITLLGGLGLLGILRRRRVA